MTREKEVVQMMPAAGWVSATWDPDGGRADVWPLVGWALVRSWSCPRSGREWSTCGGWDLCPDTDSHTESETYVRALAFDGDGVDVAELGAVVVPAGHPKTDVWARSAHEAAAFRRQEVAS